ncbi:MULTISPECIES: sigma-70 family RNA polymerase sigma factor [Cellulomonas]|uniref:RNA polymerase, sigma 28 subunit, FliA/WhiG subfamily n=1 Tax=Cellulomonas gilvus (strain ATCC 13127 / NRRL B-14078) TaxID=593907 RepID=F8A5F4_CELGA|nr:MULTISPECIES: sigma-70 family RNA polymerase sigma factor [Cellulomonas]AEI10971.1 RNA polymerase, sigma 28 subunit, FliA/WhiG subfamily [Cellulomonas gilvus ATCC 13127]MCR6688180.1 sigma-70 family RNA polymerase sigma factor [Cellulomonas sp.]
MSHDIDRDALVVQNLALVGYAVSEMLRRVPPTVSRDELASAGSLALVLAARSYDPSTGVPFARYASLRIRGALVDELRSMDWASRGARTRVRELAAASERLTAAMGRPPTREELASALGTQVSQVDEVRSDAARRVLSIDAGDGPSIVDLVVDAGQTPEQAVLAGERLRWLRASVDTLPERLRVVVRGIFLEDRSVAELAEELGVTQSRISQLRTEALGLLRDGMNTHLDPDLVTPAERPDGVAERRRQAYFASIAARTAQYAAAERLSFVPQPSQPAVVREHASTA